MTIISVFWSRVELQLLRYTPWQAVQGRDNAGADEYLLDYTEMLLPTVLMQSIRRKHFLVTIASATALLLKIQIVLSSSIFQMAGVTIVQSTQVRLLDAFDASAWEERNTTTPEPVGSPRYSRVLIAMVGGIRNYAMPLPFGVTDKFAYQTFSPVSPGVSVSGRPSPERALTATVDGLFMDTECLELENHTLLVEDDHSFAYRLKFENCDTVITKRGEYKLPGPWATRNGWDEPQMQGNDRPCAALPQEHPQMLFIESRPDLMTKEDGFCAAVLCSGSSWLSKVRVVDDGTNPHVTVAPEDGHETKTNFGIDPWDALASQFSGIFPEETIGRDAWLLDLYDNLLGGKLGISDPPRYNSSSLHEAAKSIMSDFGPTFAQAHFKSPDETLLQASAAQNVQRLKLNLPVCIAVIALSGICICSALFILISLLGIPAADHRDPMTFLGLVVAIQAILKNHLGFSSAALGASKDSWSRCTFTPLVQRPLIRTVFVLYVLGLIVGLGTSLYWSRSHSGLATVAQDGYDALAWQSLPALAMIIVSLFSASVDASVRSLATISRLTKKSCHAAEMDESLLDMMGVKALVYSWRRSMPIITILQLMAMACAFLPIMSSVLFSSEHVPGMQDLVIQQESWFGGRDGNPKSFSTEYDNLRNSLSSLNLVKRQSNITYPPNTYADLLFPNMTIQDSLWLPSRSAVITAPAAKLVSTCRRLDNGEYELVSSETSHNIRILETDPNKDAGENSEKYMTPLPGDESSSRLFGLLAESPRASSPVRGRGCGSWASNSSCAAEHPWVLYTYVWGEVRNSSRSGGDLYKHLAVWECNYTWADVTARLHVFDSEGSTLIDHSTPPEVLNSSSPMRSWEPPFAIPNMIPTDNYERLPGPVPGDVFPRMSAFTEPLSRRFALIMEPYGPMKMEDLGNPEKEGEILEALGSDLGFAAAQLANVEKRLSLDDESNTAPSRHGYLQPINATLIDDYRYRVVQDLGITIAMVSILSITFLIHVWALVSENCPRLLRPLNRWRLKIGTKGLAPPQFNTVTMMSALLHGSNTADVLPADAHLMPDKELHQRLDERGARFRIGWFFDTGKESHEYTLGLLNDEDFPFKGTSQAIKT